MPLSLPTPPRSSHLLLLHPRAVHSPPVGRCPILFPPHPPTVEARTVRPFRFVFMILPSLACSWPVCTLPSSWPRTPHRRRRRCRRPVTPQEGLALISSPRPSHDCRSLALSVLHTADLFIIRRARRRRLLSPIFAFLKRKAASPYFFFPFVYDHRLWRACAAAPTQLSQGSREGRRSEMGSGQVTSQVRVQSTKGGGVDMFCQMWAARAMPAPFVVVVVGMR
ncbi:hypothetical protein BC628DRAFT_11189 [Trametes gibbosa]|nr:hypothetical protein BC628DRAFT_11189 [Trametes gibbosa]